MGGADEVLVQGTMKSRIRVGRRAPLMAVLLVAVFSSSSGSIARRPRLVVWAWERPEDLRFIDPESTDVAFLASTVGLAGDRCVLQPRAHPLHVLPTTRLQAVVRIEATRGAALSNRQRDETVRELVRAAGLPGVRGLQIDFDARQSERAFYRTLLTRVRHELAPAFPLSMTALASWCLDDPWIEGLPVDEAVPMLFRMGPDGPAVRAAIERGRSFRLAQCRTSVGLSLDEPAVRIGAVDVLYMFNPRRWTAVDVQRALEVLGSGRSLE
jgi:hypothetical protein